ncbi:hypothetical protein Scep_008564 [Stephania cephalantha]|uniref:Uncharacterized protein n=1 Tax=Stephania cephalantha TaxID=152367 RepID=A0AAP0KEJ6_9MAGN
MKCYIISSLVHRSTLKLCFCFVCASATEMLFPCFIASTKAGKGELTTMPFGLVREMLQ